MAAMAQEARVIREFRYAAREDLDGFAVPRQIGEAAPHPDDVLRVVRVPDEVRGGGNQVVFETLLRLGREFGGEE